MGFQSLVDEYFWYAMRAAPLPPPPPAKKMCKGVTGAGEGTTKS